MSVPAQDFSVPQPPVTLTDTRDLTALTATLRDMGYGAVAQLIDLGSTIAWNRDAPGDRRVVADAAAQAPALFDLIGQS